MASQWLKARQTKYGAYAAIYILVVLAIVVVANMLANRYNKSYDTTSNKRYSLSDQTKKIVGGLKQNATITYFNQSTRFQQGKDLLDQYANLSPKVHVEYVDPDKNPQLARAAGIRDFGTAVVQIGDKKETAKSMTEEGITGAFIRDLKGTTRTDLFCHRQRRASPLTTPSATDSRNSRICWPRMSIRPRRSICCKRQRCRPTAPTLVVAGPTHDYQQPQVDAIKTYVENGGRAFFMLDPPVQFGRSTDCRQRCTDRPAAELGRDPGQGHDSRSEPGGPACRAWAPGGAGNHLQRQPIVAQMRGSAVGFPLSRSLEIKNTDKTSVEKLFDSSSSSLATSNLSSPEVSVADPNNRKGTADHCGSGHVQHRQAKLAGPLRRDRQLVVGCEPVPRLQRQRRSGIERRELARRPTRT